jgi:hypothetical protein
MPIETDAGGFEVPVFTNCGPSGWFRPSGFQTKHPCTCVAQAHIGVTPRRVGSNRVHQVLFRTLRYALACMTLVGAAFVVYNTYERTRMTEMFNILKKNNAWALQHVNSGFVLGFLTGSMTIVILTAYAYEVVHDAWSDEHWSVDFFNDQAHTEDYRIYSLQYDFHDTVWIDVLSASVGGVASMLVNPRHPFLQPSLISTHGALTALVRCALALPLLIPYQVVRYSTVWPLVYPLIFVICSGIRGLFRHTGFTDASLEQWPIFVCMAVPFVVFKYGLKPDNWSDYNGYLVNYNDLRPFSLYAYGIILACASASFAIQYAIRACRGHARWRDEYSDARDGCYTGRREYAACPYGA